MDGSIGRNSVSGGPDLLAQGSDEAVCEVAAERLLEALESGLLGSPLRGDEG